MAEIDETEMPTTSMKPETEWSTREKLAIASYVSRSGEQHWSGAGRLLRPLGGPGRPTDWFSPKFCAQQYTALTEQLEIPRRKRSERSDSSENIQPGASSEEIIISRLTKERIEELKKQVRVERTEYRKLSREIEQIESGELDDQLDDLIDEIENGGKRETKDKAEAQENKEEENTEQPLEKSTAESEMQTIDPKQATENMQETFVEVEPSVKKVFEEHVEDNLEEMDTTPPAPEKQSEDTEPVTTIPEVMEHREHPITDTKSREEHKEVENVQLHVPNETISQSVVPEACSIKENPNKEPNAETLIETKEEETLNVIEHEEPMKNGKAKSETEALEEADSTYNISIDDELKQSNFLPGTPAPSGSSMFDSFPSSPALSHSSDMDPDAATSSKAWKKSIMILWKQIASHRLANIFLTQVTDEIAPNYSTTVYRKMDLIMIKKNIESGTIRTTSEFQRDILLMFQNAIMYNNIEHDVYKMATGMQKDVVDQIAQYLATQMMIESTKTPENKSLRRSTIRRSAMSEKTGQSRSRRSIAAEGDSKSAR